MHKVMCGHGSLPTKADVIWWGSPCFVGQEDGDISAGAWIDNVGEVRSREKEPSLCLITR